MIKWFPYGENTLTVSIKQPLEDQYQSQSWEHFCTQMRVTLTKSILLKVKRKVWKFKAHIKFLSS